MEDKNVYEELSSIRQLMERSSKFISVSGLAGILAGFYALVGAWFTMRIVTNHSDIGSPSENIPVIKTALIVLAFIVLVLSLVTSYFLTARKAKKRNEKIWNPVSRRLLSASGMPFFTGGLFALILLLNEQYVLIPSVLLVFYGLALIAGSEFTFREVRWLGIGEIVLGLMGLLWPRYGVVMWALGFGVLHIIYGTIMHFKYEK